MKKRIPFLIILGAVILFVSGCFKLGDPPNLVKDSENPADFIEQIEEPDESEKTADSNIRIGGEDAVGGGPSSDLDELIFEFERLVDDTDEIEDLKESLFEFEFVTEVEIFASIDDCQKDGDQVTKGKLVSGMVIKVFYDKGESWIEKTKE